jgi:hypothetical protein
MAMCFGLTVYVANPGRMGVLAFTRDGAAGSNPDFSTIPENGIVLWNNGTNAQDGSHWDLWIPAQTGVNPMWYATT